MGCAPDRITFDIVRDGTNAGEASAAFDGTRDTFGGRIAILIGGKNMRMTETQEAVGSAIAMAIRRP